MGLQVYYVLISIYGWTIWSQGARSGRNSTWRLVTHTSKNQFRWIFFTLILLTGVFFWVLSEGTDSDVPFWDALTTAGGVVATWMLARKLIEHWLFWIILDLISMALYIYKGLYPTTILFAIYTVLAFSGYKIWKKLLTDPQT